MRSAELKGPEPKIKISIGAKAREFTEATESFAKRRPVLRSDVDTMDIYARNRAFWISGVAQASLVQQAHDSLKKAIANGTGFDEWKKNLPNELRSAWGSGSSARLKLIYHNATLQAYAAGRYRQQAKPHIRAVRPFALFDGIGDSRQSEICKARDGVILPIDDPWWNTNSPLLHHACRSIRRTLTRKEAQRRGVTAAPPIDPLPGKGFGGVPDVDVQFPPPQNLDQTIRKELQRREEQAKAKPKPKPKPKPRPKPKKRAEQPKPVQPPKHVHEPHAVSVGLTPGSKEFVDAIDGPSDNSPLRRLAQAEVQRRFPGALLRDDRGSLVFTDALTPGAAGDYSPSLGKVRLSLDSMDGMRRYARGDSNDIAPLGYLLHEEIHAHSAFTGSSYQGFGRVIEEIGTELCAREIVHALTGVRVVNGSYQRYIDMFLYLVAGNSDYSLQDVGDAVVNAVYRGILRKSTPLLTPDEALDLVLDNLVLTPEQRDIIRRAFVNYGY